MSIHWQFQSFHANNVHSSKLYFFTYFQEMDTSITAIKSLLQTAVSASGSPLMDIKKVFYGDPVTIPESDLPALTIEPISTDFVMRGNRYDQKIHHIEIKLVYNAKAYFGQSGIENDKVFAVEDAIQKVGQTNVDHETASNTVCGTIQKNPSLPYKDGTVTRTACEIAQVTSVHYGLRSNRGFHTYEVTVAVKAQSVGDR